MIRSLVIRVTLLCCALVALYSVTTSDAAAQLTSADSAAVLTDAASELAARGEGDAAAALFRLIVRRFPGSKAARSASEQLAQLSFVDSSTSGRTELQVWSTLYGLWLGVAVPGAFDASDSEAYGAGLLAGGPIGFLGGRALARSRPLSLGQARAITWGGTWGTWQGLGLAFALDLGSHQECFDDFCFVESESSQAIFGSMIAGGAVGLIVGNVLSRRDITDGLATTVNLGSLWGTWFGVAGGVIADLEGDGLWATTLIGGNLGLLAAAFGGRRWNPTRSRARIVSIAGVIGGLAGVGLDLLIQPESERTGFAIPLATSVAGLFIGVANTRARAGDSDPGVPDAASTVEPTAGALFNLANDGLRIGAPLPGIVRLPVRGTSPRLAVTIPLLSLRF